MKLIHYIALSALLLVSSAFAADAPRAVQKVGGNITENFNSNKTHVFLSGANVTFGANSTLTIIGTLNLNPASGTVNLTNVEVIGLPGGGDATTSGTLNQFANVTQSPGAVFVIGASTTLNGGTHSGTNTGDQNIVLSGAVIGSGTGNISTTIANTTVTPATVGNNTHVAQITVGPDGRLTDAQAVPISVGGGNVSKGATFVAGQLLYVVDPEAGTISSIPGAVFNLTNSTLSLGNIHVSSFSASSATGEWAPQHGGTGVANNNTITTTSNTTVGGTNTGDQLIFKNIAVTGQSTLTSASTIGTLTFAGAGGISVETDTGTNTVTVSGAGISGGSGSGTTGARRVMLFGNSISAYNTTRDGDAWPDYRNLRNTEGYMTWAMRLLDQRLTFDPSLNKGIAGDSTADMLARYAADVTANLASFDVFFFACPGTNDVEEAASAATTIANLKSVITTTQAAGKLVIFLNEIPRGGFASDSTKRLKLQQIRSAMAAWAETNPALIYIDPWRDFADPTSSTGAAVATTLDSSVIHPSPIGAYYMGRRIADALDPILPYTPRYLSGAVDVYDATHNPSGNRAANLGFLTGTGGTATAGSGTIVGSTFLIKGEGTWENSEVVGSVEASTAGYGAIPGNKQVITVDIASGKTAYEVWRVIQILSGFSTDDVVEARAEVEMSGVTNLSNLAFIIAENDGATYPINTSDGFNGFTVGKLPDSSAGLATKVTLATPRHTVQDGSHTLLLGVEVAHDGSAGAEGVFKISGFEVRKVGTAPSLVSAEITTESDVEVLDIEWSRAVRTGTGGHSITLSASGGAVTATYSAGSGTTTYRYTLSRRIEDDETVTFAHTQPIDGLEAVDDGTDVRSRTAVAVTNSSDLEGGGGEQLLLTAFAGVGDGATAAAEERGIKFTNSTGSTITLTELGFMRVAGTNANRYVALYAADGVTLIESVTVTYTSASVGEIAYAALTTPRSIANGETRHLRVQTGGYNEWRILGGGYTPNTGITVVDISDEDGGNSSGLGAVVNAKF